MLSDINVSIADQLRERVEESIIAGTESFSIVERSLTNSVCTEGDRNVFGL